MTTGIRCPHIPIRREELDIARGDPNPRIERAVVQPLPKEREAPDILAVRCRLQPPLLVVPRDMGKGGSDRREIDPLVPQREFEMTERTVIQRHARRKQALRVRVDTPVHGTGNPCRPTAGHDR